MRRSRRLLGVVAIHVDKVVPSVRSGEETAFGVPSAVFVPSVKYARVVGVNAKRAAGRHGGGEHEIGR